MTPYTMTAAPHSAAVIQLQHSHLWEEVQRLTSELRAAREIVQQLERENESLRALVIGDANV